MQPVLHYFRLHSFNLKAIAAGDSFEFPSAGGSTQLHQPLLKLLDAFLGRLEFLFVGYHCLAPLSAFHIPAFTFFSGSGCYWLR